MKKLKIEPSILSCDFAYLYDEVQRIEKAKADAIHIDVMDGHFVKNITMGPSIVAAINRSTDLFLDVHLMIYNPFDYIEPFIEAGADNITFHLEATEDVEDTIDYVKKSSRQVGLSINPETSISLIIKYLDKIDRLLFMSVNPGFGGQEFIPEVINRIKEIKKIKDDQDLKFDIQVDGGINDQNAKILKEAGADVLVSGSYLFKQKDMKEAIKKLRK